MIRVILIFMLAFMSQQAVAGPPSAEALYQSLGQQGIQYFESSAEDGEPAPWDVLVFSYRGEQSLVVFDAGELIYTYSHESMGKSFASLQQVKLSGYPSRLITSVWLLGNHGQQFVLSSPRDHKVLYQLNSSWPLDVRVSGKEIAITIAGDMGSDGIPVQETHHWSAPGVVTIHKGEK